MRQMLYLGGTKSCQNVCSKNRTKNINNKKLTIIKYIVTNSKYLNEMELQLISTIAKIKKNKIWKRGQSTLQER